MPNKYEVVLVSVKWLILTKLNLWYSWMFVTGYFKINDETFGIWEVISLSDTQSTYFLKMKLIVAGNKEMISIKSKI